MQEYIDLLFVDIETEAHIVEYGRDDLQHWYYSGDKGERGEESSDAKEALK